MKITKYDDDDFALRLTHDETIKLLALLVSAAPPEQVEKTVEKGRAMAQTLFSESDRIELFRALEIEGDEEDLGDYPMLRNKSTERVYNAGYLRWDHAQKFLNETKAEA